MLCNECVKLRYQELLKASDYEVNKVASILNIAPSTFREKCRKLGIKIFKRQTPQEVTEKVDEIKARAKQRGNSLIIAKKFEMAYFSLKRHNFNRTHAAKELGISVRTMRYYVKILKNDFGYEIPLERKYHPQLVKGV